MPYQRKHYIELVKVSGGVAATIGKTCGECFAGTLDGMKVRKGVGCCESCAQREGYLRHLSRDEIEERKTKYGFDEEKGFLGKTGCNLPRSERSPICLSFHCAVIRRKYPFLEQEFNLLSDTYGTMVRELNEDH